MNNKLITPQDQARLDQAQHDIQAYWQQTPIADRTKVIEPIADRVKQSTSIAAVKIIDLSDFMVAHPTARIIGEINGAIWPIIELTQS